MTVQGYSSHTCVIGECESEGYGINELTLMHVRFVATQVLVLVSVQTSACWETGQYNMGVFWEHSYE